MGKLQNSKKYKFDFRFGNGIRTSKKDAGVPGAGTYKHKESVSYFLLIYNSSK